MLPGSPTIPITGERIFPSASTAPNSWSTFTAIIIGIIIRKSLRLISTVSARSFLENSINAGCIAELFLFVRNEDHGDTGENNSGELDHIDSFLEENHCQRHGHDRIERRQRRYYADFSSAN